MGIALPNIFKFARKLSWSKGSHAARGLVTAFSVTFVLVTMLVSWSICPPIEGVSAHH